MRSYAAGDRVIINRTGVEGDIVSVNESGEYEVHVREGKKQERNLFLKEYQIRNQKGV